MRSLLVNGASGSSRDAHRVTILVCTATGQDAAALGATGTRCWWTVAFILLCIGVQILWNG